MSSDTLSLNFVGKCDVAGSISPIPDERTGNCVCKVSLLTCTVFRVKLLIFSNFIC